MLSQLAGNPGLKDQLAARLAGGQLSHAFILSGPVGSGRHTLAAILAAAMVCTGGGSRPCGSCSGCKKARAGIHPDIITIAPEEGKKDFSVEQVRHLRSDAWVRPNEADRKVYVLEEADRLNASAQNAMLKLLEEGPAYAAFLLLTQQAGALLPTIRTPSSTLLPFILFPPSFLRTAQVSGTSKDQADENRWMTSNKGTRLCVSQ